MAQRVVFCDASPLIGLSLVNGLGWLESLFGVVCITDVVADELLPGSNKSGEAEIASAIAKGSIRIVEDVWMEPAFPTLDEGEASILRAALNQKRPCLVVLDRVQLAPAVPDTRDRAERGDAERPPRRAIRRDGRSRGRIGTRTHGHWRRRYPHCRKTAGIDRVRKECV